ncbi:MAG: fluoride efflux transporter CrcB [Rhodospirillales bacterium]|nr:fluoride efflux transporter CrcB [Rhodospirillales bacterium]
MSLKLILFIAAGGAIGAVGRYMLTVAVTQWTGGDFPYGTILVNVLGSFLLGCLLTAIALDWSPSNELRSMIQVGVLGAFTTFSAFSMDAYQQLSRGDYVGAGLYIGLSVIISILALITGVAVIRQLFA